MTGKVETIAQIMPMKQRLNMGLGNLMKAVLLVQKYVKRAQKRMRAKKALKRLDTFVKGYYFEKCRELFYADLFRVGYEKKEERLEQREERENRLRKLRPKENRMLYFKRRTFAIDTQNRDVQWATSTCKSVFPGERDALSRLLHMGRTAGQHLARQSL